VTNGCISAGFSWRILKKQLTGPVRLSDFPDPADIDRGWKPLRWNPNRPLRLSSFVRFAFSQWS
jgi:hypothetical protein